MLITTKTLLIHCDGVVVVKADSETETTKKSQFKLFQPKTWRLPPVVEEHERYHVLIQYKKDERLHTFTLYTGRDDHKACLATFHKIAEQIKIQVAAEDREALDKAFEIAFTQTT